MIEATESLEEESGIDLYEEMESLVKKNPWAWQSMGSILGLVGGVLSPVLGTLLIAVAWLIESPEFSVLHVLSMGMFALTIPLLVGGAHCLDLLERKTTEISVLGGVTPSDGLARVAGATVADVELRTPVFVGQTAADLALGGCEVLALRRDDLWVAAFQSAELRRGDVLTLIGPQAAINKVRGSFMSL